MLWPFRLHQFNSNFYTNIRLTCLYSCMSVTLHKEMIWETQTPLSMTSAPRSHHFWESWSSSQQRGRPFFFHSLPQWHSETVLEQSCVCQYLQCLTWKRGSNETYRPLVFLVYPYDKVGLIAGDLVAGDLGALKAKSEPPSQHCVTDTELWTWKLKFLVTFQTYWLDSKQAACHLWIQLAFHQKCTANILVKLSGVYEHVFSNKSLLHCKFLFTLHS